MMSFADIRFEARLVSRAFFYYHQGFRYLSMRFLIAPRILLRKEPIERPVTRDTLSMHMLFGKRDFILALWSLASFYAVSSVRGVLYLHNDGTLGSFHMRILHRLFPSARIVDPGAVLKHHHDFFTAHTDIHLFRLRYKKFQAKKLIDPYLISQESERLILDSDMLWFKDPVDLWQPLEAGLPRALMMSDLTGEGERAYVTFVDGTRISDEIASYNSGVTLYKKKQFSIKKLSAYLARVDYLHTKFTDQACYATIFSPHLEKLPESKYLIKGTLTDEVVLRHYTNPSRAKFFIYGLDRIWKGLLA